MNIEIKDYLNCCKYMSFNELLFSFIDQSGHKDSEIYKKVDIDRKLFSKIRCNCDYVPHRNTVIKLGLALNLTKNDFDQLLKSAGYSLSNTRFDQIIAFCLNNKFYDLTAINDYLYTFCNTIL